MKRTSKKEHLLTSDELLSKKTTPQQLLLLPLSRLDQLKTSLSQIESNNAQLLFETQHLISSSKKRKKKAVVFLSTGGISLCFSAGIYLNPYFFAWLVGPNSKLPFPLDFLDMLGALFLTGGIVMTSALIAVGSIIAGIGCIIKNVSDNKKININQHELAENENLMGSYREEIAKIEKSEAPQFCDSNKIIPSAQKDSSSTRTVFLEKAHPSSYFFARPGIEELEETIDSTPALQK